MLGIGDEANPGCEVETPSPGQPEDKEAEEEEESSPGDHDDQPEEDVTESVYLTK